ncbi:uncharacterized protein LOC110454492 isoform X3 [Mizuhopecten yessoensis]|uniref:uncharacterized protein LOC110454492 isoform X3 n=1 Tax=Mizuhopecten yessoensis TaxID=6573 RepID=UPI000B4587C5|nr:uncharacterized protein LOC110454492 isoform X3 [Mizuhopecten yessoensis]
MYRPTRWQSWSFGFSDIPERPNSQINISSDSIYEEHDVIPVHGSVSSRGSDEQRQSKGLMKKIRGFFKRIKQGGKKRSVTKEYGVSDDGMEIYRRTHTSEIHTDYGKVGEYTIERTQSFTVNDKISIRSSNAGSRASFNSSGFRSSNGSRNSFSGKLIGLLTIERTPTFNSSDTKEKESPENTRRDVSSQSSFNSKVDADSASLHSLSDTTYQDKQGQYRDVRRTEKGIRRRTINRRPKKNKSPDRIWRNVSTQTSLNSIVDADSTSLHSLSDTSYQEKQENKSPDTIWRDVSTQTSLNSIVDADSTSLHSLSDTSYQEKQDFHSDCKGFPFNVARLLAIKLKVEERFVVPTTDARGKHTFIIYDKEQGRDRITTELGQKVLIRNPKSIQSEGIAITNYCREKRLDLKPTKRASLKNIIQKHTDKLFIKHSNINFISTSPVKSWWNGDIVRDEACIVIYCSSKGFVPFGEEKFPKLLTVGEVTASTDIREGYFQFGPYAYATSRSSDIHDRLKMGCQFGVEGGSSSGTIGPIVNLNGKMAFLTCAHIIYGINENGYRHDDSRYDIYIEQPSSTNFGSTGNRCGKVKRAVFDPDLPSSVGAAVVEITEQSRQPVSGEFAVDNPIRMQQAGFDDLPYFNSGKIHMNPDTINSDKRMVKFGSETHVTRGTLISEGTVVTPVSTEMGLFSQTGKKVLMRNQLEIAGITSHGAFFQPGDSGSGVFFVDRTGMGQELTCIGMAIGSTSNGTAIVTPIVDILDALQLPRSLWQFP